MLVCILQVLSVYVDFCKKIFAYEKDTFDKWVRDAVEMEQNQMRQGSLLVFRDNKLASTFNVKNKKNKKLSTVIIIIIISYHDVTRNYNEFSFEITKPLPSFRNSVF